MSEIVPTLFGLSPQAFQQQRQQQADAQALALAKLDPFQRASFGIQQGANRLAGAIGGMLGGQDPELQRVTMRQQIAGQLNPNDPASIQQAIAALQQSGDTEGAMMLQSEFRKLQESNALITQRGAAAATSQAQTDKIQLGVTQERELRAELAKLPPNATEAQIRGVMVKYGDPDKVLTAINNATMRADDREARIETARQANEARVDAAKVQAQARVDAAREAGATRLQVAQIQAENRQDLAQLTASLKGPSPAVIKAQEKAEKVAEGKEVLEDILSTSQTLIKDLKKSGGMTSTSTGPLSNLITSLTTSAPGQELTRAFGNKNQTKRDQLNSIRLQLFSAIKDATGMTSTQLNSNLELTTFLNSLGGPGMTAEANLAILDNLSKTYLRKDMTGTPVSAQPIFATNPTTKERIMSTDGGKTWNPAR